MAEGSPISLYIAIDEGQFADLDVIASAALAWDALVKEIFYVIDPSLEVRLECGLAWRKDPVSGVIGVQEGPLISMV